MEPQVLSPSLRPATPSDAQAISGLIGRFTGSGTLLPRSPEFVELYYEDFLVATGHPATSPNSPAPVIACVHLDDYSPSLAELRSLAVHPDFHGQGLGRRLVEYALDLARVRDHATLFAVSNDQDFFARFGFARRHIPELDTERSEVSRFKGVFAKDIYTPAFKV